MFVSKKSNLKKFILCFFGTDGDLNDFERRVQGNRNAYKINPKEDSSDEEVKVDRANPI